jgi:hypothetical protein
MPSAFTLTVAGIKRWLRCSGGCTSEDLSDCSTLSELMDQVVDNSPNFSISAPAAMLRFTGSPNLETKIGSAFLGLPLDNRSTFENAHHEFN